MRNLRGRLRDVNGNRTQHLVENSNKSLRMGLRLEHLVNAWPNKAAEARHWICAVKVDAVPVTESNLTTARGVDPANEAPTASAGCICRAVVSFVAAVHFSAFVLESFAFRISR